MVPPNEPTKVNTKVVYRNKIVSLRLQRWIDGSNFPSDENIRDRATTVSRTCNQNEKEVIEFYADVIYSTVNFVIYIIVFFGIYILYESEKHEKEKFEKAETLERLANIRG